LNEGLIPAVPPETILAVISTVGVTSAETNRLKNIAVSLLIALNLCVVWALPVIPGQDLPQHLSYVKILLDYSDTGNPFARFYQLPTRPQAYFTTYYILLHAARLFGSIDIAIRAVLSVYVFGTFAAFRFLVSSCARGRETPLWACFPAAMIVWSPVCIMGFLPYLITVPLFLVGVGCYVRQAEGDPRIRDLAFLALSCVSLVSIHIVSAGSLLLLAVLHSILSPKRARFIATGTVFMLVAASAILWGYIGEGGVGSFSRIVHGANLERAGGLESFLNPLFNFSWSNPLGILDIALWTVLGPYRWYGMLLMGAAILIALFCSSNRQITSESTVDSAMRRTCVGFAIACALMPWGLYIPSELTFLNFRMMTMAFAFCLAVLTPPICRSAKSWGFMGVALMSSALFAFNSYAFGREGAHVRRLLERTETGLVLMPIVFDKSSRFFARSFALEQFLPMYYTVYRGGITTSFWAQYAPHLPISYKAGIRVPTVDDWDPGKFRLKQAKGVDLLLVKTPTVENSLSDRTAFSRLQLELAPFVAQSTCDGSWCLYRIAHAPL
jgi:hypothetical protein